MGKNRPWKGFVLCVAAALWGSCGPKTSESGLVGVAGKADTSATLRCARFGEALNVSHAKGPQQQPTLAADPRNPQLLVGAAMQGFANGLPLRAYRSADTGQSWTGADVPLRDVKDRTYDVTGDEAVAFDSSGRVFVSQLVGSSTGKVIAILVHAIHGSLESISSGAIAHEEVWDGMDVDTPPMDKDWMVADANPASPYRDSLYAAWTANTPAGARIALARSTDHGQTFSAQTFVDDGAAGMGEQTGAAPLVGPDGTVYVAWVDFSRMQIRVDRSSDGGKSFGADSVVAQIRWPFYDPSSLPAVNTTKAPESWPVFDIDRSEGPHHGRLHLAWMDQADPSVPFHDGAESEIFYAHSDDGGATWSTPRALNTDAPGADQLFPALAVDPGTGSVNLSFYDTRNDPTRKKVDVYFTRSDDGGATFAPPLRVTPASTDESCAGSADAICGASDEKLGDNQAVVSAGGVAHVMWTDRSSGAAGNEEIFTATITCE